MNERLRAYLFNLGIAVDQLANAVIGGSCDETLSARSYREHRRVLVALINLLFWDRNHCRDAYIAEKVGSQLPEGYRT